MRVKDLGLGFLDASAVSAALESSAAREVREKVNNTVRKEVIPVKERMVKNSDLRGFAKTYLLLFFKRLEEGHSEPRYIIAKHHLASLFHGI